MTRARSIALVSASLDLIGGHGVQAVALAERLRQEGASVIFIPINPRFPRLLRVVRRIPYARTVLNQALYLPSLRRLCEADVVHVFSASYWSFLLAPVPAMLLARRLRRRVVLHYHSGEAEDHLANWGRRVHPWLKLADEIVVPSIYLQNVFARHGYRTRVIPNIVDTERFRFRERNPLRPALVSVRSLEPHYGVDAVIRAFVRVRRQYPEATLTVAGVGGQETALRRLAREVGEAGIRFVGRVEPHAMPALLDGGDVFANASVVDNQPVSILEAFASGLPVVSTGVGDIPELVRHGETGLVVPTQDPAALADAVARLLEQPEQARLFARRAHELVTRRGWPSVRSDWMRVYTGEAA
jgi:glycosyltransferase involved in cell wall biosynthesis